MISDTRSTSALKIGATSGLIAGIVIWMYEALVWVGAQHLLQLGDIPRNATGLVFGKEIQNDLGAAAYFIGTLIHFSFSALWGALFALIWPYFRQRGWEASLLAIFYAMFAWVVMHAAISIASTDHPNYLDPVVIIGGFVSHLFFALPLALIVKRYDNDIV